MKQTPTFISFLSHSIPVFFADIPLRARLLFSQITSLYCCQFIYQEWRTRDLISESMSPRVYFNMTCSLSRVFTDVFLQNSSSSWSLSSYQLANSKPLSKLPHHVGLNQWILLESPTMTSWWAMGRKRKIKSSTLHNTKSPWEANSCSASQKSPIMYETWRLITMSTTTQPCTIYRNHINPSHFTIILSMPWCCQWPMQVFQLKCHMHCLTLYAWYISPSSSSSIGLH